MSTDGLVKDSPLPSFDGRKSQQSPGVKSSKSLESLYTTSGSSSRQSSLLMYTRKPARQAGIIPGNSEIRQRVMSARMHSMRNLQNKLNDAQQHVTELMNENRLLRTLHKRQDSALSKYEHSNAELPQLLHSHSEEVRVWQARCRNLQNQNKELASKMKQKDAALLQLSDQNKHLIQLSMDRNLEEREKLQDRVRYLELRIMEKDEEMKVLLRRIQLDAKNFKSQLTVEQNKSKDLQQRLEKSVQENNSTSKSSLLTRSTASSYGAHYISQKSNNTKPIPVKVSKVSISTITEVPSIQSIKCKSPVSPKMSAKLTTQTPTDNCKLVTEVPSIQSIHSSGTYVKTEAMTPILLDSFVNNKHMLPKVVDRGDIRTLQKPEVFADKKPQTPVLANEIRNGMGDLDQYSGTSSNSLTDLDDGSDFELTGSDRTSSDENQNAVHANGSSSGDDLAKNKDEDDDVVLSNKVVDLHVDPNDGNTTVASSTSTLIQSLDTVRGIRNIDTIRTDMRKDIAKHESFLDTFCNDMLQRDFLLDDSGAGDSPHRRQPPLQLAASTAGRRAMPVNRSGVPVVVSRRQSFDPKKKSKLLEALRDIDSNEQ